MHFGWPRNRKTLWAAVSWLLKNQLNPEFGTFIRDKKEQLVFLCLHIRAFFPCIPPLMTCRTENAVGKIPGRCQLSSMKCGNKPHFFHEFIFQWQFFFLFVHWATHWSECGRVSWIEIDHLMSVDHFHSVALVATGCILLCLWVTGFSGVFPPPQGPYRDDSNHLAMFKAVLKKNRDGSKGGKKDSGM